MRTTPAPPVPAPSDTHPPPQNHKPRCNNNSLLESVLKAHEHVFAGHYPALVDGISLYELDQRLERWVRFHNPLLMAVTIQALELQHSIARARTALLHIRLEARPYSEHRDAPARYFRVRDAAVVSVAYALGREAPWPESVRQLLAMADEGERGGRGTVAGALVECPPLAVQTVPFGSLSARVLRGEPTVEAWKELLIDHVEEGARLRVVRK